MTPRRPATWDDCDGLTACSCHDPSICADCGCLHDEAEVALDAALRDRLGQAIHDAKVSGGPWGPACVRRLADGSFERVPYGYDGGEFEFECECPSMGADIAARALLAAHPAQEEKK